MVKSNIDKKFSAHYDAVEAELKSSTVGGSRAASRRPSCGTIGALKSCWLSVDPLCCLVPTRSGDPERHEGQAGGSGEGA